MRGRLLFTEYRKNINNYNTYRAELAIIFTRDRCERVYCDNSCRITRAHKVLQCCNNRTFEGFKIPNAFISTGVSSILCFIEANAGLKSQSSNWTVY